MIPPIIPVKIASMNEINNKPKYPHPSASSWEGSPVEKDCMKKNDSTAYRISENIPTIIKIKTLIPEDTRMRLATF